MVADPGDGDDAEAEDDGQGLEGDLSWSELHEAPVAANLDEDHVSGDDTEVVQDDEGEAFQIPKCLPCPKAPSREMVRRHNATHWPYASWCEWCVSTRRNSDPHLRNKDGSNRSVPLLVMDYCFLKTVDEEETQKTLVGKLYPARKSFAFIVDHKGTDAYAVSRLTEFIKESGLHKFVYKCDQESSIRALMDESIKQCGRAGNWTDSTVPENSAVGSSASNARAERSVQMIEDQTRTLKAALESRVSCKIPCHHPLFRWLVEHAVDIINKFSINRTGQSPYEELHGQKAKERRAEFGERVFYSVPKKSRAKMDLRWKLGVYLGHAHASNEIYVGIHNGNVLKVRSVVRVVEGSRWSKTAVLKVLGIPGALKPVDDDNLTADDIEATENPHDFEPSSTERGVEAEDAAQADREDDAHRRIRITRKDLDKYGTTPGCPRCADLDYGLHKSKKAHNEECRRRIYGCYRREEDAKWAQVER